MRKTWKSYFSPPLSNAKGSQTKKRYIVKRNVRCCDGESMMPASDLMEIITTRRSIRRFQEKEIPENLIEKLVEAARWAPSAGNCQPLEIVVIKNKAVKEDEGIGEAIEIPLEPRRLELTMEWDSVLSPGKGKRIQADTTVTDLPAARF